MCSLLTTWEFVVRGGCQGGCLAGRGERAVTISKKKKRPLYIVALQRNCTRAFAFFGTYLFFKGNVPGHLVKENFKIKCPNFFSQICFMTGWMGRASRWLT